MLKTKPFNIITKHQKEVFGDVTFQESKQAKPIVIFCHGYKGFKDWGAWHLIAEAFAQAGFFFVKFNFSHNGTTSKNPSEFTDLEAFGQDNYTEQLEDLKLVIDYFESNKELAKEIDSTQISLIGHSRGGGIALLKANEDPRIKQLITWAGVSDFGNRFPKGNKLAKWKEDGVYYIVNARTKQKMPHFIQFYEDFMANQKRLHIKTAAANLKIPFLIIHGTQDEAVNAFEAETLFNTAKNAKIKWIANANHVFGMEHPWEEKILPNATKLLVQKSIEFLR